MKQIMALGDVFSMGKIQEFREKVKGSQVAMPQKDIWRCLLAEFIGTFLLILVGCGSATEFRRYSKSPTSEPQNIEPQNIEPQNIKPSLVGVAFCFALMVTTLASTLGHISGAHLNPAVTIAFFVTRKIQFLKALLYVIVQCVAGVTAIFVLQLLVKEPPNAPAGHQYQFGYTKVDDNFLSPVQGMGIEFFISFILIFVIFAVCDENRSDLKGSGPLVIGLSLAAIILFAGPLTGAGINPARVLGPCIILGKFEDHWIYWLGPISGGIAAALIYEFLFRAKSIQEMEAVELQHAKKVREAESQPRKDNGVAPEV